MTMLMSCCRALLRQSRRTLVNKPQHQHQHHAHQQCCARLFFSSQTAAAANDEHQHDHDHDHDHDHAIHAKRLTSKSCWNCHHANDRSTFFCRTCDAIQPIKPGVTCDYFELFNMPKNFNLQQQRMERAYWNLQKKLHPDLFGAKSEYERQVSTKNAAVVNDAYHMLKDPTTRVKYILALHGIDALGESASTDVDPAILIQTMEIRERIDEAQSAHELHDIRHEISHQVDEIIGKLGEVYDKKHDLEATKRFAIELQYMMKCVEEIEDKEEQLDDAAAVAAAAADKKATE